jgi:hypothetical protein
MWKVENKQNSNKKFDVNITISKASCVFFKNVSSDDYEDSGSGEPEPEPE